MEKIKLASLAILAISLIFWVVALAGVASLSHRLCGTVAEDVGLSRADPLIVAKCSQVFSWQWWALFFELFVLVGALVLTLLPVKHLVAARGAVSHFFTIAAVVAMVAGNSSIQTYVWCVRFGGVGPGAAAEALALSVGSSSCPSTLELTKTHP
jgi:hypothetical protein